jgi:aryl-alcohol dehydrogenase-like predicted oxidoreductase
MADEVPRIELAPGYEVPRLITGAWQLSAGHAHDPMPREVALAACDRLVGQGFTAFDCADIYTGVEECLGEFIRRQPASVRQSIQVHTKFVPDRDQLPDVDRAHVQRIVDRSLTRLGVERLDLVQFSWWDYGIRGYVDAAGWLADLQRDGKIRLLGTTNFDTARCEELAAAGIDLTAHQVQYSPLDVRPEHGLVETAEQNDAWLLCYGSLAGGFLSDTYVGVSEPAVLANRSLTKYRLIIEEFGGWGLYQELLATLGDIAAAHDSSISSVALAWVLSRPRVGAAIVGISRSDHGARNAAAAARTLCAADSAAIDAVLTPRQGPPGDVFGLERDPAGEHAAIMRYNLNAAD